MKNKNRTTMKSTMKHKNKKTTIQQQSYNNRSTIKKIKHTNETRKLNTTLKNNIETQ